MELKEDAHVVTSDGKAAGRIHRVVIDPETKKVTHLVIKSGLLGMDDKVVEVQKVDIASPEAVTLLCTAEELKFMPPFIMTQYTPVSGGTFSSAATLYPNPIPDNSAVSETRRTIPEELIALKEGAPVVSVDDEQIGKIERVITDPESGQVTHFILAKGRRHKERKQIPFEWVDKLNEDKVRLTVNSAQLEELPVVEE